MDLLAWNLKSQFSGDVGGMGGTMADEDIMEGVFIGLIGLIGRVMLCRAVLCCALRTLDFTNFLSLLVISPLSPRYDRCCGGPIPRYCLFCKPILRKGGPNARTAHEHEYTLPPL
jgi:hypothetical protein